MAYAHVMSDGSYWAATGNGIIDIAAARHPSTAVAAARAWLSAHGGGELRVHGDDGRVRRTETISIEAPCDLGSTRPGHGNTVLAAPRA